MYLMPSKFSTVLVVEDDGPKMQAVEQFFAEEFPTLSVITAQSLTSAIAQLAERHVDFAVVDMSIPTYDFAADRAGGGLPQGYGGEDILLFIHSEELSTHSVVLTQYAEFRDKGTRDAKSLRQLEASLRESLDERFLGVIYYSGQHGEWRMHMKETILNFLKSS